MTTSLDAAIGRVVADGNCSGCGACSLLSSRVTMGLDAEGFLRPAIDTGGIDQDVPDAATVFARICPGRVVPAPDVAPHQHEMMGPYFSAWDGWAVDPAIRFAGSSGGVLTALAAWLVETGRVAAVAGAAPAPTSPTRTVPVRIMSRAEALASSGSRYGPVGVAGAVALDERSAIIAKPCEASAVRQLIADRDQLQRPLILSFFCAGTPSQRATDELVSKLGARAEEVVSLRYRGNGWPGRFVATTRDGREHATSYEESWGAHLGRDVQWRCKICVDGVGDHADIAVGDFWHATSAGYPQFGDEPGRSVVIARTARGDEILREAIAEGIIAASPIDLDAVSAIQPLQVERRRMLAARLLGRALAGRSVPRYPGYRLLRLSLRTPVAALRNLVGTFRRSVRPRGTR